jgi:hypothetical protein
MGGGLMTIEETPMNELAEKLSDWWSEVSIVDIDLTIPKVNEYGSHDLIAQGKAVRPELDDAEAAIYGCMFYALGKVYRALNQLNRGEMPSEDTLFDLSIYAMMARFYHADAENDQAKQKWSWFYDNSPILVRLTDETVWPEETDE